MKKNKLKKFIDSDEYLAEEKIEPSEVVDEKEAADEDLKSRIEEILMRSVASRINHAEEDSPEEIRAKRRRELFKKILK